MHPYSYSAALAVEAASDQGQFWLMYDWMYEHQANISQQPIVNYSKIIGLDMRLFKDSLDTAAKRRVNADLAAAKKLDLNATPTLILCEPDRKIHMTDIRELQRLSL